MGWKKVCRTNIQYDGDFIQRRKYNKWLEAVRSLQNGHFYQTAILKMAGLISDEPSSLDEKTYPYRVLNHLYRGMLQQVSDELPYG
jgi:hypothetical protein